MTAEELHLRRAVVCASGLLYWGGVMVQACRLGKQLAECQAPRGKGKGVLGRLFRTSAAATAARHTEVDF